MKFDHARFFRIYRDTFGPLKQSQLDGLDSLLHCLEEDEAVTDLRWAAYMLATVKHECAESWRPVEEYGKGEGRPYGNPVSVEGSDGNLYHNIYYGRGYVQLTWKDNYQSLGLLLDLGDQLLIHPERALEPATAYAIMSHGMRQGSFTGRKLCNYINQEACDYRNARRIINALDQAERIEGYAEKLEKILRHSLAA